MAQAMASAPGLKIAKTLTRRKNLENHLIDVHKVQNPSAEATPLAGRVRVMACGFCDEVFQDIDVCLKHVAQHYRSEAWLNSKLSWDNSRMLENLRKANDTIDKAWQELKGDIIANPQLLRSYLDAVAHTLHRRLGIGFETGRILALDAQAAPLFHDKAENAAGAINGTDPSMVQSEASHQEQIIVDEQAADGLLRPPSMRETRGTLDLLDEQALYSLPDQDLGAFSSISDGIWNNFGNESTDFKWFSG